MMTIKIYTLFWYKDTFRLACLTRGWYQKKNGAIWSKFYNAFLRQLHLIWATFLLWHPFDSLLLHFLRFYGPKFFWILYVALSQMTNKTRMCTFLYVACVCVVLSDCFSINQVNTRCSCFIITIDVKIVSFYINISVNLLTTVLIIRLQWM